MSSRTYTYTLVFLCCSVFMFGQEHDFVRGRLIDQQTGEPVVFATIRVKDNAIGVISNNDGGFKIPSGFKSISDTLVVSSMGYETKEIHFNSLKKNIINQILVKPSVVELSETVVTAKKKRRTLGRAEKSLTAEQIIKYAIEGIPANYDKNPFELVGYYRDYQLRKEQYINLNEALIKVVDKGFDVKDYRSVQFGLFDYKTNFDFKIDSFAAKPYDYQNKDKYIPDAVFNNKVVPNELVQLFNHDAIRNNNEQTYSYVNTFVKDFIKGHDFFTYFLTNYSDKKVYKIKFRKSKIPFQVSGDIYIDMDTYAIRKLDYAVYRQNSDQTASANSSESEMDLLYEVLLEYQNYKDHMYLNYISFHNKFKLIRPPVFFIKDAIFDPNTYQMVMVLNKPAVNWLTLKPRDFNVYYEGHRLKIKKVVRMGEIGDTYVLSFSRDRKLQRKRLDILFSKIEDIDKSSLVIVIDKMVDKEGNLIGERKSELLDQFREFFTQKIILRNNIEVENTSLVNKTISLGHEKQPNIKVKIDDYWMNTPLKKAQ